MLWNRRYVIKSYMRSSLWPMLLVLLIWCLASSGRMVSWVLAAEEGTFAGTLVANGSKDVLALGGERDAALFKLCGTYKLP